MPEFESLMSHYTTVNGQDCDWEKPVVVSYDYSPAEPQTPTYPGCEASIEITAIEDKDGWDYLPLKESRLQHFIDQAWEHHEKLTETREAEREVALSMKQIPAEEMPDPYDMRDYNDQEQSR